MIKKVLYSLFLASIFSVDVFGLTPALKYTKPLSIVNDDTIVPPSVPGFELRVIDARKRVVVELDADRAVEINIPLFIYFPQKETIPSALTAEIKELKLLREDLEKVQLRTQDPQLQAILLRLGQTIADYSPNAPIRQTEETSPASRVVYERTVPFARSQAAVASVRPVQSPLSPQAPVVQVEPPSDADVATVEIVATAAPQPKPGTQIVVATPAESSGPLVMKATPAKK